MFFSRCFPNRNCQVRIVTDAEFVRVRIFDWPLTSGKSRLVMNIIVYPLWTRVRGVDPTWKTLGCKGTSTISHCIFVCTHRRNHTSDRFERPSAVGRCSESSTVCNYSSNCNEKGKSWANKTHINKQICMMHVYIHVSNSQLYDEDDLKNLWLISCVGVCFIVQWRLILKKKKITEVKSSVLVAVFWGMVISDFP